MNRTIIILWLGVAYASVPMLSNAAAQAEATIVQFATPVSRHTEGETAWVELKLIGAALKNAVSIPVMVAGGNATLGEDFSLSNVEYLNDRTALVRFLPDSPNSSVFLLLHDDGLPETNETVILELGQLPEGVVAGNYRSATLTIQNLKAGLHQVNLAVRECNCPVVFNLKRSGDTNVALTYHYTTATHDENIIPGVDFVPTTGSVTFAAGERDKTLEVQLLDDGLPEDDKTKYFVLEFRRPDIDALELECGASISDAQQPVEDYRFYPETRTPFTAAALRPDGKILVAEEPLGRLVLLDENGRREGALPTVLSAPVSQLFWLRDGKILLVWKEEGESPIFEVNGVLRHKLARLHPDGSLDESFAPPKDLPPFYELQPLSDGRIMMVRYDNSTNRLYRLSANGRLDTSFKQLICTGFAVDNQDRTFAVHRDPKAKVPTLSRLKTDGSLDDAFRVDVAALDRQMPGYQFAGSFRFGPGATIIALLHYVENEGIQGIPALAIFDADGSLQRTFLLPEGESSPGLLAAHPDGYVILRSGSHLWQIDPWSETVRRIPARVNTYSEFESFTFLGVHNNHALLRHHWLGYYWSPKSNLLKIPLHSSPRTAIAIEPDDTAEWKDLTPIPALPTVVLEGHAKRLRIQRRGDVRQAATVTVSTRDITAKAGSDYLPASVRLEFQPLEVEKTVLITVLADHQHEPEETFEITLAKPSGAEAIAPPMRIRIMNDIEPFRLDRIRKLAANRVEISYFWQVEAGYWLPQFKLSHKLQWSEDFRTWTDADAELHIFSEWEVGFVDRLPPSARARFYRVWRP